MVDWSRIPKLSQVPTLTIIEVLLLGSLAHVLTTHLLRLQVRKNLSSVLTDMLLGISVSVSREIKSSLLCRVAFQVRLTSKRYGLFTRRIAKRKREIIADIRRVSV